MLDPRAEASKAKVRANALHQEVCIDYGLTPRHTDDNNKVHHGIKNTPIDVAAAIHEPGVRRWLVDTGCPFDLIAHKELDAHEESFIKKATKLIRLATPNGIVDADKMVSFRIPMLDGNIDAHVMKSSPTVMSIGRRCMLMGYAFVWRPGRSPFMITNKGKKINLEVIDYIPYLPVTKSVACAAGTVHHAVVAEQADESVPIEAEDTYEIIDSGKRDLKAEAKSTKHLMTHLPKNPFCKTCIRAKMENAKSKAKGGIAAHGFTEFGQHATADTIVLHGLKDRGIGNKSNAIVMFDFGTGWTSCHPVKSRSEEDTMEAFRDFVGPRDKVHSFYSDGAPEIVSCAMKMNWFGDTSMPGCPRNNSIAENKVKLVINGTRCLLLQAGLPSRFWPFASQAFCNGINFAIIDGDSRYNKRHKTGHFPGTLIPFGCLVDYYPTKRTYRVGGSSSSKARNADHEDDDDWEEDENEEDSDAHDKKTAHTETHDVPKTLADEIDHGARQFPKFSPRGVPGIFLGHRMSPGGIWKGEYLVANLSDLRSGKRKPRIQRVKSILVDDHDGYLFPMRDLYDFVQRSGLFRNAKDVGTDVDDDSGEQSVFEYDTKVDDVSSGAEQAANKQKDEELSMTDYWIIDKDEGTFVYHNTMLRKRMFVPQKSKNGPTTHELAPVRITKGKYSNGESFCITDDWNLRGSQRALSKHWTGTTTFYAKGKAPEIEIPRNPEEPSSVIATPLVDVSSKKKCERRERPYARSNKPDWCDTDSWVSMGPSVRRHLIEMEKREKEAEQVSAQAQPSSSSTDAAAATTLSPDTGVHMAADCDGDVIVQHVCENGKDVVYLCARKQVVLAGGARWNPKGLTISKLHKHAFGKIMGLAPADTRHPCLHVSCNIPLDDKYNRGCFSPSISVFADKGKNVTIAKGQRFAVLKLYKCEEMTRFHVQLDNNNMDMSVVPACSGVDTDDESGGAPSMPVIDTLVEHRQKICAPHVYSACVARPVTKQEARNSPKAMAALDKEWNKLRNIGCWDETRVEEWQSVATKAKRNGTKVHIGRIFDICVEKNSELDANDPNRKFKGRVVFEGCYVKDEDNNWAIFSEIASCPASMEASRCADAFGLLPGHGIEIADGESAYTQAKLGGDLTYIRIPRERWPPGWAKYRDPVVPLVLALYGHPDAGGFWELHCEKSLMEVGFTRAAPEWKSVFRHEKLDLLLVIYVDDFKLAGPTKNLANGWRLISSKIKMEPAQPIGRFLGCQQSIGALKMHEWSNPRYEWMRSNPAKKDPPVIFNNHEKELMSDTSQPLTNVQVMKYDMSSFLEQCVQRYLELAGDKAVGKIKPVTTPFLDESKPEFDENDVIAKIKAGRKAAQADDDVDIPSAAFSQGGGVLAHIASAVLMKILYAARMGRFDLLRPVTALGSRITTWTKLCDARLHRLVCYIKGTVNLKMYGWVGDSKDKLELVLYCDADLAGDRNDAKSTSGIFMCVVGPTSFVPLAAVSKKQTSVSKSTPEAEIVAIDHGMSKHALPALSLWENILGRKLTIKLMEDNSAACRIVITGRNPSMRHMSRTQRIDVAWLNERYAEKTFAFVECPTEFQAGDLMTKHFTDAKVWNRNLHLVGHLDDVVFAKAFRKVSNTAAATLQEMDPDICSTEVQIEATATAAAALHIPQRFAHYVRNAKVHVYTLIEFCAYMNSLLSEPKFHHDLCRTVCIDERIDGRTHKASELCKSVCKSDGTKVVLWGSLPCTGGCTWNYINVLNPGGAERIAQHVQTMKLLLVRFTSIARIVKQNNGVIIFEWPLRCTYWKRDDVMSMISELGLQPTHIHGCSLGLKSVTKGNEHMFLKKPWAIYSNCPDLHNVLRKYTCPGVSANHMHDQCRGKNAKESERYTALFAKCVHRALRRHFEYEQ